MRSIRPRPICRAHNTFSPSIALWQHFVAPNEHLLQRQLRSPFATKATRSRDGGSLDSTVEDGALKRDVVSNVALIKRVRTGKGNWRLDKDQEANFARIAERKIQGRATPRKGHTQGVHQDAEKLLVDAKAAYDSAQDYEGVVVRPVHMGGKSVKESNLPWVPTNREHVKTAEERLELEIQAFHEYIRPNQAEKLARKHVIEQVRQQVQDILPHYVLEVFGSERTGIAFAGSDIDLRLVPKKVFSNAAQAKLPPTPEERARRREDLRRLHLVFQRQYRGTYLLPTIRWARYPLISLQDKASGLDIQLVLSNDTSLGREFMQRYMAEYSYLPQLYSVIKATMDIRGLSDVFRGGIGSYSLYMMIVASLKHKPHPRNDAGGSLAFFMRFWRTFDAQEYGVSIEPAELFDKSEQVVMHAKAMGHIEQGSVSPLPRWMLTLRDPADETNDLGRKIIAWKHIRTTLRHLDETLHKDLKDNNRASLLAPLVAPIYPLQKQRRERLTEYGRYVAAECSKSLVEDLSDKFMEHKRSEAAIEEQAAATTPAAADTVNKAAESTASRNYPTFDELAAIAQAVREGETANDQSAREAEAIDMAKDGEKSEEDGGNPLLKEIVGASDHQETGQAGSFRSARR